MVNVPGWLRATSWTRVLAVAAVLAVLGVGAYFAVSRGIFADTSATAKGCVLKTTRFTTQTTAYNPEVAVSWKSAYVITATKYAELKPQTKALSTAPSSIATIKATGDTTISSDNASLYLYSQYQKGYEKAGSNGTVTPFYSSAIDCTGGKTYNVTVDFPTGQFTVTKAAASTVTNGTTKCIEYTASNWLLFTKQSSGLWTSGDTNLSDTEISSFTPNSNKCAASAETKCVEYGSQGWILFTKQSSGLWTSGENSVSNTEIEKLTPDSSKCVAGSVNTNIPETSGTTLVQKCLEYPIGFGTYVVFKQVTANGQTLWQSTTNASNQISSASVTEYKEDASKCTATAGAVVAAQDQTTLFAPTLGNAFPAGTGKIILSAQRYSMAEGTNFIPVGGVHFSISLLTNLKPLPATSETAVGTKATSLNPLAKIKTALNSLMRIDSVTAAQDPNDGIVQQHPIGATSGQGTNGGEIVSEPVADDFAYDAQFYPSNNGQEAGTGAGVASTTSKTVLSDTDVAAGHTILNGSDGKAYDVTNTPKSDADAPPGFKVENGKYVETNTKVSQIAGISSTDGLLYNKSTINSIQRQFARLTGYKQYTVSGTIADNGKNSQIEINSLPPGLYTITMEKNGFRSVTVQTLLDDKQIKTAQVNIIPQKNAEPPAIDTKVTKTGNEKTQELYWSSKSGKQYAYLGQCPWWGWQQYLKDGAQFACDEPPYGENNVPAVTMEEMMAMRYASGFAGQAGYCASINLPTLNKSASTVLGVATGLLVANHNGTNPLLGALVGGVLGNQILAGSTININAYQACLPNSGNFISPQCSLCSSMMCDGNLAYCDTMRRKCLTDNQCLISNSYGLLL